MSRRKFLNTFVAFMVWAMAPLCLHAADSKTPKEPNIIFILADDQGWNALSTPADPNDPRSGSTYYQTPRLAKLAAEGMRFSQAYSPAPTCSPSRWAIQFGRSPASLKIWGAEWAATGKVTQKVPKNFPTADTVKLRKK